MLRFSGSSFQPAKGACFFDEMYSRLTLKRTRFSWNPENLRVAIQVSHSGFVQFPKRSLNGSQAKR